MGKVEKAAKKAGKKAGKKSKKEPLDYEARVYQSLRAIGLSDDEITKSIAETEKVFNSMTFTLYGDELARIGELFSCLRDEINDIFDRHDKKRRFSESIYGELISVLECFENEPFFKTQIQKFKNLCLAQYVLDLSGSKAIRCKKHSLECFWSEAHGTLFTYLRNKSYKKPKQNELNKGEKCQACLTRE